MKTKIKKKLLIVDGNNLLYRSFHKFKTFSNKNGQSTGCIYGFFKILHSVIFRVNADKLIICFDHKRSKDRLEKLPTYKERKLRVDMDFTSFNLQKRVIMRMLRMLGITYIWDNQDKYTLEADDYIALCVKNNMDNYDCYILSSDEDFVQLINKGNTKIINPNKDFIIQKANCEKIFGYKPEHALDYKILVGDTSDNIKGFPGIGPKTALKFLEKHGDIKNFLSKGWVTDKKFNKSDMSRLYLVNSLVMDIWSYILMHPVKHIPFHARENKSFKRITFIELCEKYSLNSFKSQEFLTPFLKLRKYETCKTGL